MHIWYWWESQKRPLGRPRCRWVDNIKMDLTQKGWGGRDWIDLAQDRNKRRDLEDQDVGGWIILNWILKR
jgi:hypothetical protein